MEFEWNAKKDETNRIKHGVPFEAVHSFAFETAYAWEDDRRSYGEKRMIALGLVGARVHHLVYTERGGAIRVISPRKATEREIRTYVENI